MSRRLQERGGDPQSFPVVWGFGGGGEQKSAEEGNGANTARLYLHSKPLASCCFCFCPLCFEIISPLIRCFIPEDLFGPQALEVSADGVQAPVAGVDAQRTEDVLGVCPVEVKGDAGDVFPVAWLLVATLVLADHCTLWGAESTERRRRSVISIQSKSN